MDVFSKFLYLIPVKTKSGRSLASAFRCIFYDYDQRKYSLLPVWLRTDRGKDFLNKYFQELLLGEGIEFQSCKNPDVKHPVVERAHRTIRDEQYKYFTYKIP